MARTAEQAGHEITQALIAIEIDPDREYSLIDDEWFKEKLYNLHREGYTVGDIERMWVYDKLEVPRD